MENGILDATGFIDHVICCLSVAAFCLDRAGGKRPRRRLLAHCSAALVYPGSADPAAFCCPAPGIASASPTRSRDTGRLPRGRCHRSACVRARLRPLRRIGAPVGPDRWISHVVSRGRHADRVSVPPHRPHLPGRPNERGHWQPGHSPVRCFWLSVLTHASLSTAVKLAILPFLPGDALKVCRCGALAAGFERIRRQPLTASNR